MENWGVHAGRVTLQTLEFNSKLCDILSLKLVANSINQVLVETPKKHSHGSCYKN